MVGDAFAFLDPVFSSGVYLAMSGAEQAAKVVDSALREPRREASLLRKLEKRQRAGMARFAFFIYQVQRPDHGADFSAATQSLADRAGCDLNAGGRFVRFAESHARLRAFKVVYALTALRHFMGWRGEHRYRLEQAKLQFTGGTTPLDRE
jgi:flavin-dependent dehydrogenase